MMMKIGGSHRRVYRLIRYRNTGNREIGTLRRFIMFERKLSFFCHSFDREAINLVII